MNFFLFVALIFVFAALYDSLIPDFLAAREELFQRDSVKLKTMQFVVLDTETTGLDKRVSEIIEIAAFKIQGMKIIDQFHTYIRPMTPITPFISDLTKITNDMVQAAPPINMVMPRFLEFTGDAICVAHNANFDQGFLQEQAKRLGQVFNNPFIDTLAVARAHYPFLANHKLETIAEEVQAELTQAHSGLADARCLSDIFLRFLAEHKVLISDYTL